MPQLEPGHRPPAASPPPHRPASPATSPAPAPGHLPPHHGRPAAAAPPRPPRSVTSTRTTPPTARTATVTVTVFALQRPDRYARTPFPNSSSSPAERRHPGTDARDSGTPAVNARATRARSARFRTPSRSPGSSPWPPAHPPLPGPPRDPVNHPGPRPGTRGCTPGSAARVKPGTRRRRGPSVAVRETADGAHRPSQSTNPVRHASVDTATHRLTVTHHDARRDKKETARLAENSQLAGRFTRWWQVLGSNQRRLSRRFYRPLPLATRATCRVPSVRAASKRIAQDTTRQLADGPSVPYRSDRRPARPV